MLSGAALTRAVTLAEPDDYAYRASIVALTEGHVILSDAEYQDLAERLQQQDSADGLSGSQGIAQWTQLDDGSWVSEKNPGYPFLVAPFALVGLERLAPLFYGALGCVALFFGGRRWLGAWGGTFAVGLFCSSGAALAFAWRAWMPTFTGAALIAAGAGALLWALLAVEKRPRLRTAVGLLGFLALEGAMLVRYTDAIALAVAAVAVLAVWVFARGRLPRRALLWWFGSAVLAGALVLAWNAFVYGSVTATGYASGVITFGLGAIGGNLDHMPLTAGGDHAGVPARPRRPRLDGRAQHPAAPHGAQGRGAAVARGGAPRPRRRRRTRRGLVGHVGALLHLLLDGADEHRAGRRRRWRRRSRPRRRGQRHPPHQVLRPRAGADRAAGRLGARPGAALGGAGRGGQRSSASGSGPTPTWPRPTREAASWAGRPGGPGGMPGPPPGSSGSGGPPGGTPPTGMPVPQGMPTPTPPAAQ